MLVWPLQAVSNLPTPATYTYLLVSHHPKLEERQPAERKDYADLLTQGTHYLDLSQHRRG